MNNDKLHIMIEATTDSLRMSRNALLSNLKTLLADTERAVTALESDDQTMPSTSIMGELSCLDSAERAQREVNEIRKLAEKLNALNYLSK